MNSFEHYLMKDESSYDCRDVQIINKEFQEISTQLMQEGKHDIASICDLDRQVFSVQKSFFSIIMKLSKYRFIESEGENNDDNISK